MSPESYIHSDTGAMLADQFDRLFSERVDAKLMRAVQSGDPAATAPLAQEVEALGLTHALVPEDAGGAGLAWTEIQGVLEALGRHVAPLALPERMAAAWAMAKAGLEVPEDAPIAVWDRLTLSGETVSGKLVIPFPEQARQILAVAGEGEAARLVLLEMPEGTPLSTIGQDPRRVAVIEGAQPLASAPVEADLLLSALAVMRAGQMAGAMAHALALSIDYGNTRVQFGRPIGKFQAIQHLVAEQAGEAAAAKASVQLALRAMDRDLGWEAAAVAKIRNGMAVAKVAAVAHAVHGAIGVTEEHMLHHTTRRLWQWREEAGDENAWSERLGRAVIARGGQALWPGVVALTDN